MGVAQRHGVPAPHRGNTGGGGAVHAAQRGQSAQRHLRRITGQPELITRANGTAVVGLSFSAYGERRDTDWDGPIGSTDLATLGNTTREGYTGHAMLDGVGLVHMNGRVYDPLIGRFLSRDPIVDGRVSQGANGYAYVWNNPLTLNDPTGLAVSVDDFQRQWETGFGASWLFWPWMTHHHDTPVADKYRRMRNPPPAPSAEPAPAVREVASTTPMNSPIGVPLGRNEGIPWHGMTAEELAELRADAYLHGADALEFLGYTLIALDVANTMTGVLAGPDVGLAGIPLVGLATSLRVNAARGLSHWGNPKTLARHFRDHGADFGAKSADDYTRQASDFLRRSQADRLPTKIDADGMIRVYDPRTNTFGSFNPDGTTRTFFKPTSPTYFDRQPGGAPWGP